MKLKISVYIATSLDGFIARKNGEIDRLTGGESGQEYGYAGFISNSFENRSVQKIYNVL